jgi:hypothetical protein
MRRFTNKIVVITGGTSAQRQTYDSPRDQLSPCDPLQSGSDELDHLTAPEH